MELTNTFTVNLPVDRTWEVITDLERVAPCLPGAALLGVEGEDYLGGVKIKVGPVTAQYEGVARFTQRDDAAHHAIIRAEGRDVRGQGNAAATIDMQLHPQGEGTEITINTDLALAGRVAQFGRGVIADVSGKLIGQFAQRLEAEMASSDQGASDSAPGAATSSAPTAAVANRHAAGGAATAEGSGSPRRRSLDDIEPLNLISAGSGAVLKQALPVLSALLGLLVGWLVSRRRSGTAGAYLGGDRGSAGPSIVLTLVLPSLAASGNDAKEGF